MNLIVLGMAVLVAVAAGSLGMWVERVRGRRALRRALACYRDLHKGELERVEAERDRALAQLDQANEAAARATAAAAGASAQAVRYRLGFDQANGLLGLAEAELARTRAHRDWAVAQVEEALRIIADLTDARVADAERQAANPFQGTWLADPLAWANLQEARENPEAN